MPRLRDTTPEPEPTDEVTPEPVAEEPVTPEPVAEEPVTPEPVGPSARNPYQDLVDRAYQARSDALPPAAE